MGQIADFVQLKNGDSLNGIVDVKVFTIKSKYGTLKWPKKDLLAITYKNPPYYLSDHAQISAGTRIDGEILPAIIPIRIEGTRQTIHVPKKDIHTLVMFFGDRRAVSKSTMTALAKIK